MIVHFFAETDFDFQKVLKLLKDKELTTLPESSWNDGFKYIFFETDGKKRVEFRNGIDPELTVHSLEETLKAIESI